MLCPPKDPVPKKTFVSLAGGLEPTGPSDNGEVEDYLVTIEDPGVSSVTLNGNEDQRSQLSEVVVMFNSDFITPASAFQITNRETGETVESLQVSSSLMEGKTVSVLTFAPGAMVNTRSSGGNSLVDGIYQLNIDASKITPVEGGSAMADNYVYGDQVVDRFFRLFGDSDGDRDVDVQDYGRLGQSFLQNQGSPSFNPAFDSDGDGDVDGEDFGRFRRRFLKTLAG